MFCRKCGKEIQEGSLFCCYCGEQMSTAESSSVQEGTASGSEDDRIRRIVGNNADHYIQCFKLLRGGGKDKINWASLLLGILHAGYRNVWKQWLHAMWLPIVIGWGAKLLYGFLFSVNTGVAFAMLLCSYAANIWLLVAQILFARKFNRLYMQHVEQKLAQNDLKADPSCGRSAVAGLILGVAGCLVNGIYGGLIVWGMDSLLEDQQFIDNDYEEETFYSEEIETFSETKSTYFEEYEENSEENTVVQTGSGPSWVGDFQRTYGPDAGIRILEEDEDTILFSAGIGSSGYLAYLDMRACVAYKGDAVTAYYYEPGSDYELTFTYRADGTLLLEENTDHYSGVNLAGVYVPEDAAVYPDCEYVFSDSDTYEIFLEDSESLTELEREIARNEIYARHGVIFEDEALQNYFEGCSWYEGWIEQEDFSDDMLNEVEKTNIRILR